MEKNLVFKKFVVVIVLMLGCATAWAQSASISLSEDSALFNYNLLIGGQSFGRSEFGVGFLFNKDKRYLMEVGLQVKDEAGSQVPGLTVGLGGKFYGATLTDLKDDQDVMALAIAGMLRFAIPRYERFALRVDVSYAPNIVTFLDAERFWELALRAEFEVLPTAAGFIEYRQFTVDLEKANTVDIDAGVRLGIYITF